MMRLPITVMAIRVDPKCTVHLITGDSLCAEKTNSIGRLPISMKRLKSIRKDARTFVNRGFAWFSTNEIDKAIADYSEAIQMNSNLQHEFSNSGNAWCIKGEFDNAISDYDSADQHESK